jgi:electron transport complex protein RnfC
MGAETKTYPGKGVFARGVHPPEQKHFASGMPIEVMPTPAKVEIPLHQHTGAPCEATVKAKDEVAMGDKIGEAQGFISASVHASIAGTVGRESVATLPNGRHVAVIPVKAAEEQLEGDALREDILGGEWPVTGLEAHTPQTIAEAVREAGIVGQGGAAFPTGVKVMRNEKKPVDVLLVNGCECEPYLTADDRLMIEAPGAIISGSLLAAEAAGATRVMIAIEDNKPEAAESMRKAAEGTKAEICIVHTKYPMGGERQVIVAVLGREVPTGGLPLDVGVVVINVGTASAIARAVSVTGAGIKQPKNLLVPIGITYGELIDFCGGLTEDAERVLAGGPMMGFALGELDVPVTKGTSGITVLTHSDVRQVEETACVRCGRCVDVCPLNLVPTKIALAARHGDWDLAKQYQLQACCECGCCAYVCPAGIPLVQLMRMGKAQMPRE